MGCDEEEDARLGNVDEVSWVIGEYEGELFPGEVQHAKDKATWEELKAQNVDAVTRKSSKKLFVCGQTKPIEILGTFNPQVRCDVTGMSCEDQFKVMNSKGTSLLSKGIKKKLNVLHVGSVRPGVYSITSKGTDAEVRKQFPEVFSGIGKF